MHSGCADARRDQTGATPPRLTSNGGGYITTPPIRAHSTIEGLHHIQSRETLRFGCGSMPSKTSSKLSRFEDFSLACSEPSFFVYLCVVALHHISPHTSNGEARVLNNFGVAGMRLFAYGHNFQIRNI